LNYLEINVKEYEDIPKKGYFLVVWPGGEHQEWIVDGLYHREDGPAMLRYGKFEWRMHGSIHRNDGPAVIWPDGTQEWWISGKRHRIDGPAVVFNDGIKRWFIDDKRMTYNEWQRERKPWLEQQRTQEIKDLVI
jgi:hypothetical protein